VTVAGLLNTLSPFFKGDLVRVRYRGSWDGPDLDIDQFGLVIDPYYEMSPVGTGQMLVLLETGYAAVVAIHTFELFLRGP
jgi:hypothetical protein